MRHQLKKFTRLYTGFAVLVLNTLVLFGCINMSIGLYGLVEPDAINAPLTPTPQFELTSIGNLNQDFDLLRQVYDDLSDAHIIWLILEHANNPFVCDDDTGYRERPVNGRYMIVHDAGFRQISSNESDSQPWPPNEDSYNIFVFGGSTTFGAQERGNVTIPAWLQSQLRQFTNIDNIVVYNFGTPSYSILEERQRFIALIDDGFKPDLAIFIDGLNEFTRVERVNQLQDLAKLCENTKINATSQLQGLVSCQPDELCLPLGRFYTSWQSDQQDNDREINLIEIPPDDDLDASQDAIQYWLENKLIVEHIADENGVELLFVIQPVPGYAYNLENHLFANTIDDLRPGQRTYWGYPIWNDMYNDLSAEWTHNVINLSTLGEDNQEPIYVDRFHYTASFMLEIAVEIKNEVMERNLLKLNPD